MAWEKAKKSAKKAKPKGRKIKRAMVRCAHFGCRRLVFVEQVYCWKHMLELRDEKIKRITGDD